MNLSGTLTINGSDLTIYPNYRTNTIRIKNHYQYNKNRSETPIIFSRYGIRKYYWSPWCIVSTDHKHWMLIETIDHPENNYNLGKIRFPYDKSTFNHWKYIFTGELEPVILPTMEIISNFSRGGRK